MKDSAEVYQAPLWLRYSLPLAAVGATLLVRIVLIQWFEGRYPLILFLVPVVISAWFGGTRPALLAGIFGVAAGVSLFKPYNLQIGTPLGLERLAVFTAVCSISVFIITRLHKVRHRAEENERRLQAEIRDRAQIEDNLRNEMAVRMRTEAAYAEALEKAEAASRAKTEFLANMSHEIRTPMNAVIGLTHILAMNKTPPAQQKEIIATLKMSADSLLSLIDDMLDITKIEAGSVELEMTPFNLRHIAEDVMTIMAVKTKEKKLNFSLEAADLRHADFIGDPTRLKQIMMNLCGNAIKFTHEGSIRLCLKTLASLPEADRVVLSVTDTGIGIAGDKLKDIFEKFIQADSTITRQYGGSGLGLAIVKNLTEAMGGDVSVASDYGAGSVFTVRLPLRRAAAGGGSDIADPPPRTQAAPGASQVLVVEDNPANILVMRSFMEQFGFGCDVAASGAEALKKLEAGRYFAVLMDVQMPGLSGLETARIIRGNETRSGQKRVPIIGLTAYAMGSDRELCLKAGMDDYLSKPFNPDQLEKKLKNLCADYGENYSAAIARRRDGTVQ